jgi:hypothetical protein
MKQYYYYYAGGVYQSESDRATLYKHILPSDIRDYAKSRGWIFNQATIKDGFYLGSNSGGGRQLNFPVNTDAADYFEALTINKAVSDLVTAIQADTLDNLVDEIKQQQNHFISSNLCKAITNFQEEHEDFDLMLDFKWSLTQPQPQNFRVVNDIKIQRDYFARIDDVRRDLRNTEKQKEDFFVGSVERLDGEIIDGQRAGEVILNLYREDEIIRAKVILDAEQYKLADAAHMAAGDSAYIHLRGKLHTGNQPRLLTDISYFELITR